MPSVLSIRYFVVLTCAAKLPLLVAHAVLTPNASTATKPAKILQVFEGLSPSSFTGSPMGGRWNLVSRLLAVREPIPLLRFFHRLRGCRTPMPVLGLAVSLNLYSPQFGVTPQAPREAPAPVAECGKAEDPFSVSYWTRYTRKFAIRKSSFVVTLQMISNRLASKMLSGAGWKIDFPPSRWSSNTSSSQT